ncbi:hypothetical protein [Rubellimicrobium sp. CFH 75288]|uniref:hypothetical protein n=1 Tax=Rubellimicrobium sp. CFH 75288 TaxID=2697034 RepID=UPI0014137621|nr:hypothetical protein [Rubellimicrobium sp. CFH 75288]NAZ37798.1 hypothetical protein [Rubellimicrobium sp. CFH 75288]
MSRAFGVLGVVLILLGLLWAAQGAGWVPWPTRSPMLGDRAWIGWGLGLAVLGAALALWSGRR